ncbi:condensation domain-containing protein [Streptomyces olindensis]|uniref:Condensation domain-containing protein n=1 Tax=Streptomyces olindensis TaxID=358823 RepID=A0ABV2Y1Q5_9ACTN
MTLLGDPVPLSPQQEWLWESLRFMHPDEPGRTKSNVCLAYTLQGPVDADRLERALDTVRRRHDTLRTTFDEIGDTPRQEIQDPRDAHSLPFALVDLSGVPYQEQHRLCELIANGECDRVFDYVQGPLWHATLVRRTPREHVLVFSASHLMLDAPSVQVVIRHLAEAYEELPPPERQDQYRDFVWRARELPKDADKRLDYWRRALTPLPAPLAVPTDYPAAPPPVFLRETEPFTVQARTAELADLRGKAGVTPYLIHVAAYTAALAALCRARRIVVGSSLTRLELKADLNAVGHFADLVLLPVAVHPEHTFGEHLEHVRDTVLDVYDNLLPYPAIAEAIDPGFEARRPWPARALYHVWVRGSVLSTDLGPPERLGEAGVRPFSFAQETCYSIDLDADRYAHVYGQNAVPTLYVGPSGLEGEMTYNRAVFTPSSARRFIEVHRRNLERLLREPRTLIGEVRA